MVFLFWLLLGVLLGVDAARKRGFSVVAGVLGGLLLGPLAVLMYFVSGVSRSDRRQQCPQCAEFIKAEARICKHCRHDLVARAARGVS